LWCPAANPKPQTENSQATWNYAARALLGSLENRKKTHLTAHLPRALSVIFHERVQKDSNQLQILTSFFRVGVLAHPRIALPNSLYCAIFLLF
jgi:hypothetical protein